MAEPTMEGASPQRSEGLSTGAKLLIGCLGCLGVIAVVAVVGVAVGGVAFKSQIERFVGGVSDQQEASETLERVRREHPFTVPDDGVVTEDQVERFVDVTDRAWEGMEPWAQDLVELSELREAAREGSGGIQSVRELAGGVQGISGFARARVQIAEALDDVGMSLGEYVWTGISLSRASADGDSEGAPVPEANRELVERYEGDLPVFGREGEGEPGPELVLGVATIWGMSDQSTWQALGLDTLQAGR